MKAENLQILKEHQFNIPSFWIISRNDFSKNNLPEFPKGLYAVRSSAPDEDGNSRSHAGEYDTFLNVPSQNILERIQDVFGGYQNHHPEDKVIVQEMVDAELSGVLFTASPIGAINLMRIAVGHGTGDNVVDDREDVSVYTCSAEERLYQYTGDIKLDQAVLQTLIDNGTKIRKLFGMEMDIEFAIKNNDVYILQARPITTIPKGCRTVLDNTNIIESYPGTSAPFTQEYVKGAYTEIFTNLMRRLTEDDGLVDEYKTVLDNMVCFCNGKAYYNIDSWYEILKLLPFKHKMIGVWQEMMGVEERGYHKKANHIKAKTKFRIIKNVIKYLINTPSLMDRFNQKAKDTCKIMAERLEAIKASDLTPEKRIQGYVSCYLETRKTLMKDWFITLVNDMYAFLFTYLSGKKNLERIQQVGNLKSMEPAVGISKLKEVALQYGYDSPEYQTAKEDYIEEYGDRCVGELKLETKTFRTNPELLDQAVKNAGTWVQDENTDSIKDGFFVRHAKIGIQNREISRLERTKAFGLVRHTALLVGVELKETGLIDDERDVFFLTTQELTDFRCKELKAIINERKAKYSVYENIPCYKRLVFKGRPCDMLDGHYDICNPDSNENIFYGDPVSEGYATGEAIVLKEPDYSTPVKNKIIVTESTDPGWVFLIRECAGVVAERGSLLSHTAIISRELKKPAIVNVKGAARNIRTGDMIRIDTNKSLVCILEKNEG